MNALSVVYVAINLYVTLIIFLWTAETLVRIRWLWNTINVKIFLDQIAGRLPKHDRRPADQQEQMKRAIPATAKRDGDRDQPH